MPAEPEPPARLSFEAMGTSCHLFAPAPGERLQAAADWVVRQGERFTRFQAGSELSRLNAGAGSGWIEVSEDLESLLRAALDASLLSGGLVNAAVLPSMLAIGYTRTLSAGPTPAVLTAARPLAPLPELLQVEPGRARLAAGAGLDLGGIAKGWLADRLAARLGESCLVNLGGDLAARGGGVAGEGWPVGLGDVTVLLRDQGAATSSTERRRWKSGEAELHHLIDPRTGLPARTDLTTVSVVARSATVAEVAAKTALLLGSEAAPGYLAGHAAGWYVS